MTIVAEVVGMIEAAETTTEAMMVTGEIVVMAMAGEEAEIGTKT